MKNYIFIILISFITTLTQASDIPTSNKSLDTARTLLLPQDTFGQPSKVKLSIELVSFFDKNGCDIPRNLREKLKEDGKKIGLIPEDLQSTLGSEMDAEVQKISGTNVNAVLHTADFQLPNNPNPEKLRVTGTGTYNRLNAMSLIDTQYDNFAYTMDCSGFLNSAIAAGGGIKSSQTEASAKLALQAQKAMLAVRASVNSPIAMAINPDMFSDPLSRPDRMEILYSLISEVHARQPAAPDQTIVRSWRQVAVLWTSNQGTSSLQGRASFSTNASLGIGVFSASANLSSGSTVGRNISFAKFDTYIIDSFLDKPVTTNLKLLYETVEKLVNNALVTATTKKLNETYLVSYALPKLICNKIWTLRSIKTNFEIDGNVLSQWENNSCSFTLSPAQALPIDERGIFLYAPTGYNSMNFTLPVKLN